MKKKILFVMNNLNCGGAEKALVSLLNEIDFELYEVDLFLFKKEGIFLSLVPSQVKIIEPFKEYEYFDMPIKIACKQLIKQKKYTLLFSRIWFGKTMRGENVGTIAEQKCWKFVKKSFKSLDKQYDLAVGYLEKNPIYFCIDFVKANKKIGFIHNDYKKLKLDKILDYPYLEKLDYIFTVSSTCVEILHQIFPEFKEKCKLMHNILPIKLIQELSNREFEKNILKDSCINIVSVGRLAPQKGYELSVQACSILRDRGYSINWVVIGEGLERDNLERLIQEHNIQNTMHLIGIKENPYPYIKMCDIFVQTSLFEGKSIAIDEAKVLEKAIVATNFPTVYDQLIDKKTGMICEMNPNSVANKIEELINNRLLKLQLETNLKNIDFTSSEIDILLKCV
ncbi:glycosyltransferase [Turicibacter sanguinis]|uniref:glycosyltransferase n=1 Tax=Turicibacter sanguinis TaxID=154288 RepID=UPI0018A8DD03|nr:glycosyltransferase [Turicibacter sanguinis]MDB8558406.1 glycosyltransferase [Turicibacter sanguinis]MDB8561202.1 glycosyltransferase [Turicibacter sanguinis]